MHGAIAATASLAARSGTFGAGGNSITTPDNGATPYLDISNYFGSTAPLQATPMADDAGNPLSDNTTLTVIDTIIEESPIPEPSSLALLLTGLLALSMPRLLRPRRITAAARPRR